MLDLKFPPMRERQASSLMLVCPTCDAGPGQVCVAMTSPLRASASEFLRSKYVHPGQPIKAPHSTRIKLVEAGLEQAWARSPAGVAAIQKRDEQRARWAREEEERRIQRVQEQRVREQARDARNAAAEKRDAKREAGGYNWDDDDSPGKKRQRLVQWLMSKPRCVPLSKARIIAARKYPL